MIRFTRGDVPNEPTAAIFADWFNGRRRDSGPVHPTNSVARCHGGVLSSCFIGRRPRVRVRCLKDTGQCGIYAELFFFFGGGRHYSFHFNLPVLQGIPRDVQLPSSLSTCMLMPCL